MEPVVGLDAEEYQLPEERGEQYAEGRDAEDDQVDLGRRGECMSTLHPPYDEITPRVR